MGWPGTGRPGCARKADGGGGTMTGGGGAEYTGRGPVCGMITRRGGGTPGLAPKGGAACGGAPCGGAAGLTPEGAEADETLCAADFTAGGTGMRAGAEGGGG